MDRRTDGQTDGRTDGRTDRQTSKSDFTGRCPTNVERKTTNVKYLKLPNTKVAIYQRIKSKIAFFSNYIVNVNNCQ